MNVLEMIGQAFGRQKRDELLSFADYARSIADKKTVDPEKLAAFLRSIAKTPADLADAVNRIETRRALKVTIEAGKVMPGRRSAMLAKRAEALAELQAAQKKYEDIMGPTVVEERELKRLEREADQAQTKLQSSATQEDVSALEEAARAVQAARKRQTDILRERAQHEDTASTARKKSTIPATGQARIPPT